jgi:hypothetical protein
VTSIDLPHYPACDFGNTNWNPLDVAYTCDNKLIGARTYLDTYKRVVGLEREAYDSARGKEGRGTHTAATAAGNAEVESMIFEINTSSEWRVWCGSRTWQPAVAVPCCFTTQRKSA